MLPNASTWLGLTCYTAREMVRAKSKLAFNLSDLNVLPGLSAVSEPAVYDPGVCDPAVFDPAVSGRTGPWHARGLAVALLLVSGFGCQSGGVGDPCTPEDEFFDTFSGFSLGEVNVESRSFQCETRVCLVNKFQGRVSCPYGTKGTPPDPTSDVAHNLPCEVPGFGGYVSVPVEPQRTERPPEVAVYCSCRCDGKDPNARYCECPSGFECTEIVVDQAQGQAQLAGSYCIRAGSNVDPARVDPRVCSVPPAGSTTAGLNDLTCGDQPAPAG